jgi:hypothetical protein
MKVKVSLALLTGKIGVTDKPEVCLEARIRQGL